MKAEPILIERPERQSWPRRIVYAVLTVIAWVAWGLLWLPALHRLAREWGLPSRYARWIPDVVLSGLGDLAGIVWLAPLSLVVFLAWSLYEGRRRTGGERRRRAQPVALPATAQSLGTSVAEVACIQNSRRAVLRIDDEGGIGVATAEPASLHDDSSSRQERQFT